MKKNKKKKKSGLSITRREFYRQLFHMIYGMAIVMIIYIMPNGIKILSTVLAIGIVLSIISMKLRIPGLWWFLKTFERPSDLKQFPGKGAIVYLASALFVSFLFERNIAMAAIAILALGDSVSHMFGRFIGKRKTILHKLKFIEGTIAGIIAATAGATVFVAFWHASIAAIIAMLIELVDMKYKIDDNILLPVVSALVLTVLALL